MRVPISEFKVSAETILTIAADPKHLGARTGIASMLHRTADQPKQNCAA
jgi:hypothetical protein